ncbi:MAG TPA: hypothetical protein ENJ95_24045 [Bacteroidetes bacterium]|nr:hypothetical protein [Bacteroidota bacterium]
MNAEQKISIADWTEQLLSRGRWAFSLKEVKSVFSNHSDAAIKLSLNRLTKKGKIISVYRGYYLVVPPQYKTWGIIPAVQFIDGLMTHLNRDYYVGLLNAAALHGSAHQAPQVFQVFTVFPFMNPIRKKGIKVIFINKNKLPPSDLLEKRKTVTGYVKVSKPALTAIDLIQFQRRIGGMNRAATVIEELAEEIKPEEFDENLIGYVPMTALQRLGFLLELLGFEELADALYEKCLLSGKRLFKIPLKPGKKSNGSDANNRWNILQNITIETDL